MVRAAKIERQDGRLAGDHPSGAKTSGPLVLSLPVLFAVFFAMVVGALFVTGLVTAGRDTPRAKTAAIVDQLSLTEPNPAFVEAATELLEGAGYSVKYYSGEEVTVDFYRNLPDHGYRLLILRNHSSVVGTGSEVTDEAGLYTSEPYSESKYVPEQTAWQLMVARYHEGGPRYFGITPAFVRSSMRGEFDDATILMMGCDGMRSAMLAEAFLQRGAGTVVGWDRPVSAEHTDTAATALLRHLLVDELAVEDAVARTAAEVGSDPEFGTELRLLTREG